MLSDARQREAEACTRESATRLVAEEAQAATTTAQERSKELQRELAAVQATNIEVGHLTTTIFQSCMCLCAPKNFSSPQFRDNGWCVRGMHGLCMLCLVMRIHLGLYPRHHVTNPARISEWKHTCVHVKIVVPVCTASFLKGLRILDPDDLSLRPYVREIRGPLHSPAIARVQ